MNNLSLFFIVSTFGASAIDISTSVFASDDGHSNNQSRLRNKYSKKYSKKQNFKKIETYTMYMFVCEYKYLNCEGVETKVEITCDDDDETEKCR